MKYVLCIVLFCSIDSFAPDQGHSRIVAIRISAMGTSQIKRDRSGLPPRAPSPVYDATVFARGVIKGACERIEAQERNQSQSFSSRRILSSVTTLIELSQKEKSELPVVTIQRSHPSGRLLQLPDPLPPIKKQDH